MVVKSSNKLVHNYTFLLKRFSIGDLLVTDSRLLYRNGESISNCVRWTALPRYGYALVEEIIERGWQTIRSDKEDRLSVELHPELINIPNK